MLEAEDSCYYDQATGVYRLFSWLENIHKSTQACFDFCQYDKGYRHFQIRRICHLKNKSKINLSYASNCYQLHGLFTLTARRVGSGIFYAFPASFRYDQIEYYIIEALQGTLFSITIIAPSRGRQKITQIKHRRCHYTVGLYFVSGWKVMSSIPLRSRQGRSSYSEAGIVDSSPLLALTKG